MTDPERQCWSPHHDPPMLLSVPKGAHRVEWVCQECGASRILTVAIEAGDPKQVQSLVPSPRLAKHCYSGQWRECDE